MKKNEIELRPTYWASISGGKDSLYMLYFILNHLDDYPLDGVVHFELEIDYPFIHDVIDYVEARLKQYNIPVMRIKPRNSWESIYNKKNKEGEKYLYPTRFRRWCNSEYKMDCSKQLEEMMRQQGKRVVYYIGFCSDETKRFKEKLFERDNVTHIYPLAEHDIEENTILEWAKTQDIYNNYYKTNRRCGCMGCPMATNADLIYLKKYYPEWFDYFMEKASESERERERRYGKPLSVWGSDPKYNTEYKIKRINELIEKEQN